MRKEPFAIGDYVHVYNRGNRKQEIVRGEKDKWHFLQMLYYFNTRTTPENPFRSLKELLKSDFNSRLVWPAAGWGRRQPIVKILAFVLMKNHFHLLLKEIMEGGVTLFMRRLGTGMTNRFNKKYNETGRLFQSAYKARRVSSDLYFQYLSVYIQVKNSFELYSGGIEKAKREFDKAFNWAAQYPYCSLGDYVGNRNSPIIDKDLLGDLFPQQGEYKKFAQECLSEDSFADTLGDLILEETC